MDANNANNNAQPILDPLAELNNLRNQVALLVAAQPASPPSSSSHSSRPKLSPPSFFDGDMGNKVDDWIDELTRQFLYYGNSFGSDEKRIQWAATHFRRTAATWWRNENHALYTNWSDFVAALHRRFRPVRAAMAARQRLRALRQRVSQSVSAYTNTFQSILTNIADMGESDQVHNYVNGLLPTIAAKVWEKNPTTLVAAIEHAVAVEGMQMFGRIAAGKSPTAAPSASRSSASAADSDAMDINNIDADFNSIDNDQPAVENTANAPFAAFVSRFEQFEQRLNAIMQSRSAAQKNRPPSKRVPGKLTHQEIEKLKSENKCFHCKKTGHFKTECPDLK